MVEDYNPEKETVREYVFRALKAEMDEELRKFEASVLYGENSGGPLRGLLNE